MESHVLLKLLSPYAKRMELTDEEMLIAVMQILASPSSAEEVRDSLLELLSYSVLDDPLFNDLLTNRENYLEMFALLCPDVSLQQPDHSAQETLPTQPIIQHDPPKRISISIKTKKTPLQIDVPSQNSAEEDMEKTAQFSSLITIPSTITHTIYIPHVPVLPTPAVSSLRSISDLPPEYQKVFPKRIKHLNRIQSESYDTLFNNSCNVLLCAPTGAGKTVCALLCMLRAFSSDLLVQNDDQPKPAQHVLAFSNTPVVPKQATSTVTPASPSPKSTQLVVYLTPMKALASEMTVTFTEQLEKLGLVVLECTGDEAPPQAKLLEANLLICTPEKWDVLTRKPVGEVSLIQRQTLLIIDEIHLLGVSERGPVLESIIMRTFQYSETSQRFMRIIGISATVPNYRDVAEFLHVPPAGLLYYGQEYRPVPLVQTIVGVKPQLTVNQEKLKRLAARNNSGPNEPLELSDLYYYMQKYTNEELDHQPLSDQMRAFCSLTRPHSYPILKGLAESEKEILEKLQNKMTHVMSKRVSMQASASGSACNMRGYSSADAMDAITVSIVKEQLMQKQNQILVFVHSRIGTQTLARLIGDMLRTLIQAGDLAAPAVPSSVLRSISGNKQDDLSQLVGCGVAYHNAGMEKSQRQAVEQLFRDGVIRVVCCTTTLAWGVNMPCSTVIIRGTDIFSAGIAGQITKPTDINVLDIQQIFGRAGRPQYTASGEVGHGIILTDIEKVDTFVRLLNNESPIESHMQQALPDILNAELILGNVSSVTDCISLLRRSFLATRVLTMPWLYGAKITKSGIGDDGNFFTSVSLDQTLRECVMNAILNLATNKVLTLDSDNEHLFPTEIGRICSYYYVSFRNFCKFIFLLKESVVGRVAHDALLGCLSECSDFSKFIMRKSEMEELSILSGDSFEYLGFYSGDSVISGSHGNKASASAAFSKKDLHVFRDSLKNQCDSQAICRLNITNIADIDSAPYKVNILLQSFISQRALRTQSLVTDQRLCVTVAPRILRAFAEASLVLQRVSEALKLYDLASSIEYQRWFQTSLPLWPIVRSPVGSMEHTKHHYLVTLEAKKRQGVSDILTEKLIIDFEYHRNAEDFPTANSFFSMTVDDISTYIYNRSQAKKLHESIAFVPRLVTKASLYPVSNRILRLSLSCTAAFRWNKAIHGEAMDFLVIVYSQTTNAAIHYERLTLTEQTYSRGYMTTVILRVGSWKPRRLGVDAKSYTEYTRELETPVESDNTVGIVANQSTEAMVLQAKLVVMTFPELWLGGHLIRSKTEVSLKPVLTATEEAYQVFNDGSVVYPKLNDSNTVLYTDTNLSFTPIPLIPSLSIRALHWPEAEAYFQRRFSYFNLLQSVMFHKLFYTSDNVIIGCPTGSGKTTCSELAILQHIRDRYQAGMDDVMSMHPKIVYIAPMKALIRERYNDWAENLSKDMNLSVMEITGESLPAASALYRADIILATPEKFDAISRQWQWKKYIQMIGLMIFDELHLVGTTRGYVLESIICRMRYLSELLALDNRAGDQPSKLRIIALSTVSANTGDLARWLNIKDISGIFNFNSAARPVKLETHIQGFPGWHYSPRMTTMNRPIYTAIKKYSPRLPVLIFVASRRQTRRTAMALISFAEMDSSAPPCLQCDGSNCEYLQSFVQDPDCKLTIGHGIGLHHAGMTHADRAAVEKLYLNRKISILVATSTLAWGLNLPAFMTIIKGCEYFDGTVSRYVDYDTTDVIQMAGRAGRPQYTLDRLRDKFATGIFGEGAFDYLVSNKIIDQSYIMSSGGRFSNKKAVVNGLVHFTEQIPSIQNMNRDVIQSIVDGIELQLQTEPQSVCLIFCKTCMKEFYKQFFSEPFPFESSMISSTNTSPIVAAMMKKKATNIKHQTTHFPDIVNAEVASFGSRTMFELRNWLQNSFLYIRARRNPLFYDIFVDPLVANLQDVLEKANFEDADYVPTKDLREIEAAFRLYLGITSADDPNLVSRRDSKLFCKTGVYLIKLANQKTLRDFLITQEIYTWIETALLELSDNELISLHKKPLKTGQNTSSYLYFQDIDTKVKNILAVPTPLGEIVSRYYIRTRSGALINAWLMGETHTLHTYLDMLVRCEEFQEIPIRHNEDRDSALLLQKYLWDGKREFSGALIRYNMPSDIVCTEPSFKAYILLQAQLVRSSPQGAFELPVVDYWLDLATIIDAAIRITVATVEIALAKRLSLSIVRTVVQFSQGLVQGLWPDMDARLSVSSLRSALQSNKKALQKLSANGISTLHQLVDEFHKMGRKQLIEFLGKYQLFSNAQRRGMCEELIKYPNLFISAAVTRIDRPASIPDKFKHSGKFLCVSVSLKHMSSIPNSPFPQQFSSEIYTKSKPHTWFLILSESETGSVIDYKRLSGFARKRSQEFVIPLVSSLCVSALSDCFLGIDKEVKADLSELKLNETILLELRGI